MPDHEGGIVREEILTTAPPERVWEAWVEPDLLAGWLVDRADARARTGVTVNWYFDRFGVTFPSQVLVADPGERLVLKGFPVGRAPFVLEVLIGRAGAGTSVRVINSGFATGGAVAEEELEGARSGWQMALSLMRHYLERHFGWPRTPFFAMQPAPLEYDGILHYFTEAPGLSRWLTREGSIGEAGSRYELVLREGRWMTGEVLAVTSREVAVSWEEINGAVELKAFRLGPRLRALCVRGCGWGLAPDKAAEIDRLMAASIDRLVAELVSRRPTPAAEA